MPTKHSHEMINHRNISVRKVTFFGQFFVFILHCFRGEMLTKVRQFREKSARLNSDLKQVNESLMAGAKRVGDVEGQVGPIL